MKKMKKKDTDPKDQRLAYLIRYYNVKREMATKLQINPTLIVRVQRLHHHIFQSPYSTPHVYMK